MRACLKAQKKDEVSSLISKEFIKIKLLKKEHIWLFLINEFSPEDNFVPLNYAP